MPELPEIEALADHLWLVHDPMAVPRIAALGPDALTSTLEEFDTALQGNSGRIKTVITGKKAIAGIGNAYSDKILHVAKLSPIRHREHAD